MRRKHANGRYESPQDLFLPTGRNRLIPARRHNSQQTLRVSGATHLHDSSVLLAAARVREEYRVPDVLRGAEDGVQAAQVSRYGCASMRIAVQARSSASHVSVSTTLRRTRCK
jgi:hypothetical protein